MYKLLALQNNKNRVMCPSDLMGSWCQSTSSTCEEGTAVGGLGTATTLHFGETAAEGLGTGTALHLGETSSPSCPSLSWIGVVLPERPPGCWLAGAYCSDISAAVLLQAEPTQE